jgi:BRO family, N-terminal domain/P63C domain
MNNSELVPFIFDNHPVRTIMINGEPWVVVADVCAILGYSNPRDALIHHVDAEDKGVAKYDTLGGPQKLNIVNEFGLYSLILGSTLSDAKRFKRWVTHEVLPSIRKTGKYAVDLRGWLSSGPKPWSKMFPDRFYAEILRLHGKDPTRLKEQEPWLSQKTDDLIYNRIEEGLRETLCNLNPVPEGKRWRRHKHHQYFVDEKALLQLQLLIAECMGTLSTAQTWEEFLSVWNVVHPLVEALPPTIEALLADDQLWLFNLAAIGSRP